jgi:hypothetical protein
MDQMQPAPASAAGLVADSPSLKEPRTPRRGHGSFRSAFDEAVEMTGGGVRPKEIRVRWNPSGGSFTWTIEY